jgi:hypothetical protein
MAAVANYADNQDEKNRKARREYRQWFDKLPRKEQERLTKLGLDDLPKDVIQADFHDVSDMPLADDTETAPDDALTEAEITEERVASAPPANWKNSPEFFEEVHCYLRRVLGELRASDNTDLTLDCFCLATGMQYEGASETAIAKRHICTRAAVSKRVVCFSENTGLPPSRAMRSLTAREVYARKQHTIRANRDLWRPRRHGPAL